MPKPAKVLIVTAIAVSSILACSTTDNQAASVVPATQSDTVVVRSSGDGVWGPARDARPILEVRGTGKEYEFSSVQGLAATPDGGVLLFDAKGAEGAIIRQFDSSGKFIRNIGRAGSGPGEYTRVNRIRVGRDGAILVRSEYRLIRYSADGRYADGFNIPVGSGGINAVLADDGKVILPATYRQGTQQPETGAQPWLRHAADGTIIDTVAVRGRWADKPLESFSRSEFAASEQWIPLPDGRVVVTRTDKLGFVVADPGGKSPPVLVEREAAPIAYPPDELAQMKAARTAVQTSPEGRRIAAPGDTAQPIAYKLPTIFVDFDVNGRVWIAAASPSQKSEPRCTFVMADAQRGNKCVASVSYSAPPVRLGFETDGRFLGELRFPFKANRITFVGDYAWAVVPDQDDVPVLTKFSLRNE